MEVQWTTLLKYLARAAAEDLAAKYQADGWVVKRQERIGQTRADLVARRGDELLIFEFKTPGSGNARKRKVTELRRFTGQHPHARLKLVLVRPPQPVRVKIDGFEQALFELCLERYDSLDVAELASGVIIEEVGDIEVEEVHVSKGETRLRGTAALGVTLEYGKGEDGTSWADSYPLNFDVILAPDLTVEEVEVLEVDTSSFYGESE